MIRLAARRSDLPEEWYDLVMTVESYGGTWSEVVGNGSCCIEDVIKKGEEFVRLASQGQYGTSVEHAGLYHTFGEKT